MLLRLSSAVALLPAARRAGVKSLPAIARRGKATASLLSAQSPASVLFPRLVRRSMTVRACTAAELSPEVAAAVAAVDAQAKEVSRLKGDEGLGNKDPQVEAAVAELLRLKALLPESLQGPKRRTKEEKKAQKAQVRIRGRRRLIRVRSCAFLRVRITVRRRSRSRSGLG